MVRATLIAATALALLAGSARADVIYSFVETKLTGPWQNLYTSTPAVTLSFELTDAAIAQGSFSMRQWQQPFWQTGDAGLESLTATGPNMTTTATAGSGQFTMNLTFGANGQITSSGFNVFDGGGTENVTLSSNGNKVSGFYNTDGFIYGCARNYNSCGFSGHWQMTQVPVPEPSSRALFGFGLAGLFGTLALRRRPRQSARIG